MGSKGGTLIVDSSRQLNSRSSASGTLTSLSFHESTAETKRIRLATEEERANFYSMEHMLALVSTVNR